MKLLSKAITLALLVAMVSPVGLAYGRSQTTQPGSAACHEHGHKVPAPSPGTYHCCRGGHQFAAVREAVKVRPPSLELFAVIKFALVYLTRSTCQGLREPAGFGSPGIGSLRI
jgi:hypothetical protein